MTNREAIKEFKERITLAENEGYADTIPEYIEAMNMAISCTGKAGAGEMDSGDGKRRIGWEHLKTSQG